MTTPCLSLLARALRWSAPALFLCALQAAETAPIGLETRAGSVEKFARGATLFSNRTFRAKEVPPEVDGAAFVKTTIENRQVFRCTAPGTLYVLTPALGNSNSMASALEARGFARVGDKTYQAFGKNPIDQAALYRGQMKKGDILRTFKWAVLLAPEGIDLTLHTPGTEDDWSANAGERLYNGIVLPKEWPPAYQDEVNPVPMSLPYLKYPPKVIPIDVGRQLFVDDFLVESTDLTRTFHKPQKYAGNPVMKPQTALEKATPEFEIHDKGAVFLGQGGVFYDPQDKLFKMYYTAGWRGGLALATSKDMVNWDRPELGLYEGNLLLPRGAQWKSFDAKDGAGTDNCVWYDLNAKDPDERLKFTACWMHAPNPPKEFHHTLYTASADGKHWSEGLPMKPPAEDYTSFFYNPFRDKWVFSLKTGGARGRARLYTEKNDFRDGADLSDAVFWTAADERDQPEPTGAYPGAGDKPQLYSLNAVAYESILVGMHYIHRGPSNEVCVEQQIPKLLDLELGFSRDGFHWDRPDRTGFIKGERTQGAWDRGYLHGTAGVFVVMGDELVFPYVGTSGVGPDGEHSIYSGMSVGLAKLRRDGFASMDAPAGKTGTLTTRLLTFGGKDLFVNAQVGKQGALRAEVLDENNRPIAPYTLENSIPFQGDATRAQLRWKGADNLAALAGKPVRLRFSLSDGQLYAFWVSKDASGRSDGYLAAGSPGHAGVVDVEGSAADAPAKP